MTEPRIIFMGTPDFAVPSLEILYHHKFDIAGVITAPDKPKGRGQHIAISPVKELSLEKGLRVLQPNNLKSSKFLQELESLEASLQVVVAFRILPEVVWSRPELGTFNLHASLLPQYRGAAPINWAIINGEAETGVSTFFLKQEVDTGSMIFQEREPILPEDNAGSLYKKLMAKGADLVLKTVRAIRDQSYTLVTQSDIPGLKMAPKIFKGDCQIKWDQPVKRIHNFIRGLSPYPAAWTLLNGKTLKIFESADNEGKATKPGKMFTDNKTYLRIGGQDGYLEVLDLQLEGKRRMAVSEFLRGYSS